MSVLIIHGLCEGGLDGSSIVAVGGLFWLLVGWLILVFGFFSVSETESRWLLSPGWSGIHDNPLATSLIAAKILTLKGILHTESRTLLSCCVQGLT